MKLNHVRSVSIEFDSVSVLVVVKDMILERLGIEWVSLHCLCMLWERERDTFILILILIFHFFWNRYGNAILAISL